MNRLLILLSQLSIVYSMSAQKEQYTYDVAGNRTMRNICTSCRMVHEAPNYPKSEDTLSNVKIAMEEGISVFPNPTLAGVTVSIAKFTTEENTKLFVMDAGGKVMITQDVTSSESQIDLSKLMQGVYYVRVVKGKNQLVYKILKVQ